MDPSPWPMTGACGTLLLLSGFVSMFTKYDKMLMWLGLILLILTMSQWWRDVTREATMQGKHTSKVEDGMRMGMLLFIMSEVCFFFAFFWAYFHSSLSPNIEVGAKWPPISIIAISPFDVPLLNTTVLLSSGATITWAHMGLLRSERLEVHISLGMTISLGCLFTMLQWMEYNFSTFSMADSVYGSTFFLATGFHGLHVLIGTLFIMVMWIRQMLGHFSSTHHFGFEGSAWYWHFVDVVWLFLFLCIYWWGM